jgi:hypothetical protein
LDDRKKFFECQSRERALTFVDLRIEILLLHLQLDVEPENGRHRHEADDHRGQVAKTLAEKTEPARGAPVR